LATLLRHRLAVLAIVIVGTFFLSAASGAQEKAASNSSRVAQEEDIHAAAFLFLFDVNKEPGRDNAIYCLSVDTADSMNDPSDSLLKRVRGERHVLRKASGCKITTKRRNSFFGVYDKKTGKHAWMISVGTITWLNDQDVRVCGRRLCGGLCMWSTTLEAHLEDGKWKVSVPPDAEIDMSQAYISRDEERSGN